MVDINLGGGLNDFVAQYQAAQASGSPVDPQGIIDSIFGKGSPASNAFAKIASAPAGSGSVDPNTPVDEPPPVADEFPLPENGKPTGKEPIDDKYKNADGSTKSASQILSDSPICANLGDQKDIKELKASAKKEFGDWETEKDPEVAARSAIKFRQLLEYSDNSKSKNGNDRGEEQGNGSLSGITNDGDIRDGTEASTAINYFRHGRQFVLDSTEGGRLKQTNDKYVREDGTTRSDAGQFFVDVGKGISHVIPGLGNVISGTADGLDRGFQEGDFGKGLALGLKGGVNGALYTAKQASDALGGAFLGDALDGNINLDSTGRAVSSLFDGSFTNSL